MHLWARDEPKEASPLCWIVFTHEKEHSMDTCYDLDGGSTQTKAHTPADGPSA